MIVITTPYTYMCICIYIYVYIYIHRERDIRVYIYIYIERERGRERERCESGLASAAALRIWELILPFGIASNTANLCTNIIDFGGFDSSIILILRGGILMSIGDFPESLSQAI